MAFFKKYFKTIILFALIVFLSVLKEQYFPKVEIRNPDKWVHMIMYLALAFVFTWESMGGFRLFSSPIKIILAVLIPTALGALVEGIQYFIPWRDCSIWDLAADFIGVMIGFTGYWTTAQLIAYYKQKK